MMIMNSADELMMVMMGLLVMRMKTVMTMMMEGLLDSTRSVRLENLSGSIVAAAQSLPLPESGRNAIGLAVHSGL